MMRHIARRLILAWAVVLGGAPWCCGEEPPRKPTHVAPGDEQESGPSIAAWPVGRVLSSENAVERQIRAALDAPCTDDWTALTLADLAAKLEERLQATVLLDLPALMADGRDPELKLRGQTRGRSLRQELQALLDPLDVKALVRNESLWLTTGTAAETMTSLRVYQVHDLVVAGGDEYVDPDFSSLMHLIYAQCGPDDWCENGGRIGVMQAFEGPGVMALVVVHTDEGHDEIARLLAQLRAARVADVARLQANPENSQERRRYMSGGGIDGQMSDFHGPPLLPPPPLPRGKTLHARSKAEQNICDALKQPAAFDWKAKSLFDVPEEFEAKYDIHIELDEPALLADGKCAQTLLTFHWRDGSLGSALKNMLDFQALTYVVADDALRITTKTNYETLEFVSVYQVHDLLMEGSSQIKPRADFVPLSELITNSIQPEIWRDNQLYICEYESHGIQVLVIRHTQKVLEEIDDLFDLLRDAHVPAVYEAQRRRPIVARKPMIEQQPAGNPTQPATPGGGMF